MGRRRGDQIGQRRHQDEAVGFRMPPLLRGLEGALQAAVRDLRRVVRPAHAARTRTSARADCATKLHFGGSTPDFGAEVAVRTTAAELRVERSYIVLSDAELRAELSALRLLKGVVKSLHSITIPSEADPSNDERGWVFRDPSAPWRRAKLSVSLTAASSSSQLPLGGAAYVGEGRGFLRDGWKGHSGTALGLLGASLPTVTSFVKQQKNGWGAEASVAPASPRPDDDGDDDQHDDEHDDEHMETDDGESEIVGIAAAEVASGAKSSHASPGKPRPPVPPFCSPPAKLARTGPSASSAAPSVAGSIASSTDDGDESPGEDDMEGDALCFSVWRIPGTLSTDRANRLSGEASRCGKHGRWWIHDSGRFARRPRGWAEGLSSESAPEGVRRPRQGPHDLLVGKVGLDELLCSTCPDPLTETSR